MKPSSLQNKEMRRRHKEAGLCRCGNPPIQGYELCQGCVNINNRYKRKLVALGLCGRCGKEPKPGSKFCDDCLEASSKRHEEWRNNIYQQILDHYGGKCVCCGETNLGFLTLDHKNNDGAKQRRQSGTRGGYLYYLKVIRDGFPNDLQILCFNCNCGKNSFGFCPHTHEGHELVMKRYPNAWQKG